MAKFDLGHTLSRGKRRAGAGRKRSPARVLSDAIKDNDSHVPEMFEALRKLAIGSGKVECKKCGATVVGVLDADREAIFYLLNRSLGTPKVKTELEIAGGEQLGVGQITAVLDLVAKHKKDNYLIAGEAIPDTARVLRESYTRQWGEIDQWPEWARKAVEAEEMKLITQGSKEVTEPSALIEPE